MEAERSAAVMSRETLVLGVALIAIGILMPALIPIRWLGVLPKLSRAMAEQNQGLLVLTAAQVVLLNTVHALPQVLGAIVVADERP